jgi:dihydrodipicolinate synthase/N-acetylneuraminate lyase
MKRLRADELRGNWCTPLLPIRHDDSIDFQALDEQLATILSFGVDGIYTNGTAAEFFSQTEDEFDRVSQQVADACHRTGVPFQLGVSHTSPWISRDRLRRAVRWQPSALQLILPDWPAPSLVESVAFLQTMERLADGIGLVLYNPPHAKRHLLPREFAMLHQQVPSLIGLKVAGGDETWFTEMNRLVPKLSVFVPGHFLADMLPRGAHGAYSNVACLHPGAAQQWYRQMHMDPAVALELGVRIKRFMADQIQPLLEQQFANHAIDKLLACIGGWTAMTPRVRWPYQSIPVETVPQIRDAARRLLPEFFPER